MKRRILFLLLLGLLLVSACSQVEPGTAGPSTADVKATEIVDETPEDAASDISPTPEATNKSNDPIEVSYFTPAQGEGPNYPVSKPDDRDNDLTVLEEAAGAPAGEIIEFSGKVYDAGGFPQPGVVIEIWQTDSSGVYLHPNDPGTEQRDRNFQFYGEAVTAADGSYSFRTILPGHYEPRPRHIHVKVKYEGLELLTTQFYFAGDSELVGEAMLDQAGDEGAHLIIELQEEVDGNGETVWVGERDIILAVDLSD